MTVIPKKYNVDFANVLKRLTLAFDSRKEFIKCGKLEVKAIINGQ